MTDMADAQSNPVSAIPVSEAVQPSQLPTVTPRNVLIMAAGTGGHVFPALAVAQVLQQQGHRVHWLVTEQGMEHRLLQDKGIPLHPIKVQGLRGNGLMRLIKAPFMILSATQATRRFIQSQKIDVVAGFGGYVAGPGGLAAKLSGRPLVIHEQNAIAGLTNRVLARWASVVCQAFPGAFAASPQVKTTGNPVRQPILAIADPATRLAGRAGPFRLLIVGGSLGAQALNQHVPVALQQVAAQTGLALQVTHQCGQAEQAAVQTAYAAAPQVQAEVVPFIQDMAAAYAQADLVICRAGALTVTELACAGVPAIFVPLPHAVDDHQTANAQYLVQAGAARLLPQPQLMAGELVQLLPTLLDRAVLQSMAQKARAQGHREATQQVAQIVMTV